MRGPTLYQLHLPLDKPADEQLELIDLIAERVQTLGGVADDDPRHVAEITTIPRPPNGVEEVPAMLSRLVEAHELIIAKVRHAITRTAKNRDDRTNDLLCPPPSSTPDPPAGSGISASRAPGTSWPSRARRRDGR
ncbi:MAG: Dps family protein [Pseudonocardiaceae bacterium]